MDIEKIVQIISILGFSAGAIVFFVNTGAYKREVEKDIEDLKKSDNENKEEIKNLRKDFENLRNETTTNTTRIEALLIEVKTKLELLMQVSGIFNKNERIKK